MRMTMSGKSWITSIFQTTIWKPRLTSVDLATLLASRQLPHTYQQLHLAFSQQPSHHQEVMDGDGRSTQLGEEEEEAEAVDFKEEEAAVGVVEEATEEEAKEIEIKVKMVLT